MELISAFIVAMCIIVGIRAGMHAGYQKGLADAGKRISNILDKKEN